MTITPFPASGALLPVPSDREVADTIAAARSDATPRAYRTQWRLFRSWANEVGLQSLPASAATVARYLVARHRAGATAVGQAHKAAGHPSRVAEEAVGLTIAGIARSDHRSQAQAAPLDAGLDAAALDAVIAAARRVPGGTPRRAGERRRRRPAGPWTLPWCCWSPTPACAAPRRPG